MKIDVKILFLPLFLNFSEMFIIVN